MKSQSGQPSCQLTILLYFFLGCTGGGFFAGSFSPQFTLTLRVLPSDKLIEDAVGTGAGATCVAEPDTTGMLLDLLFCQLEYQVGD